LKVVPVPVEYANPLVNKYLTSFPEVSHLYEHDPYNFFSFIKRQEIVMNDYHTDRNELVRILTEYNERLNCGEKTRANLKKLKDRETTVVVTGQQAGVLTGPLYTIYKTITAIQLSREITEKTGQDVIPVFWVAAEDHDYAEIDHVDLLNREHELIRLKLDYTPPGKCSVGHIPVTEAVFRLIEQLEANTNPSEWKGAMIGKLKELAQETGNLADWFAAVMSWLFAQHGVVMVNPLSRDLRRLWSRMFEDFLRQSDLVNERLRSGMAKVLALGIEPQVEKPEDNVNVFLYVDGERLPLLKSGDVYTVRGREQIWSLAELTAIAREKPELLSPNVVLRPVAQDFLLPILAYVAGPGEISYYALYREIYPLFNQRMPVIYPRSNLTLVERGTAKNMERYGINFPEGAAGLRHKLYQYLDCHDRVGIDNLFESYAGELEKSYQQLVQTVAEIDAELVVHGKESLHKILHQVEHFRKKTHQYHRKSCDLTIKRFHSMENQLFPRNNWQERVFNIFPYLFRYGLNLTDQLAALPLLGGNEHKLVYMGD